MSEMEDKLNSLSPQELNALNTDPELLQAFKTKYGTHGHDTLMSLRDQAIAGDKPLQNVSMAPITQPDLDQAGTQAAEAIGGSKFGQQNPNLTAPIAAAVGTGIAKAPDIAMAAQGLSGLGAARAAAQAGDLGLAGRVISGPGRAEAGQAVGAAEQAAGVHPDIVPTIKDVTANLGLKNANAKQYLNALMERLKSGEEMSAEALSQHHKMITDLLSNEPSGIAKNVMGAPSKLGNTAVATATKADKLIVQQLNTQAPGRADAAADYAASMIRNKIYKGAAGAAAAYAGRNVILDAFNRFAGGK